MGVREHLGAQVRIGELPTWRRGIVLTGFLACLFLVWMAAWTEIRIYYSAPKQPSAASGQVYETHVMHGSTRYVSSQQQGSLAFWEDEALPWAGIPFLVAFFTLVTGPRKRPESLASR